MAMDIGDVERYLRDTFVGINAVENSGDTFVMYDPDADLPAHRQFPFVTLVTGDTYDQVSDLNRTGAYRLNIGLPKAAYTARFGAAPTRRAENGVLDTGYDYARRDALMPHPVYAAQYWMCVVEPGEATFEEVKPLLAEAHAFAARKYRNERARSLRSLVEEHFRAFVGEAHGQELEAARLLAQDRAYEDGRSREERLRWAAVSLEASRRQATGGPSHRARSRTQEFLLRMWVIERLGPDDRGGDWNPETLAGDTLDALELGPAEASALAAHGTDLGIERMRELRRHKNMTAHLEELIGHMRPGPVRDRLRAWAAVRPLLP
ncbi:DUF6194 family protein [Streptomyces sp. NEAU-Y11]|uniref:DUF6194 family protein n=1 Tax=Streptomyces cucumeris TaxID=2962890 RepID=UPI0020C8450D|nr:DUF6194 family protein [Streptomyces sp. NEAU-Y11]MCP9210800.1 DUF6194 family protein [Streptomyces sp. NEAU-Y11]